MATSGGAGAVVRQGHLRKLKTMNRRYFVLRSETADCSARLEYYESEKKFRAGAAARRGLSLRACFNITRRLDLKQKYVIALYTKEDMFGLVADNEEDLNGWFADILKQHHSDDASIELLHPIQHVWQVNLQKRGLGNTLNILGIYNLCLTDKTLTLTKVKQNNQQSQGNSRIEMRGVPDRIEYSLKNIRRCGYNETFFYMEVGRQTVTGPGELWMHTDDANIAQSMHAAILCAMSACNKKTEDERDHVVMLPGVGLGSSRSLEGVPARRQTFSEGRTRSVLSNDKGLCVGSCIRQCVCSTATYSIDDSASAIAPLTPKNVENQPPDDLPNDSVVEKTSRVIRHHRTVSLPTRCLMMQEPPLKIVHERTRSAPLTGNEIDSATIEKPARHGSLKVVNGTDLFPSKKTQWPRRASTGARLSKLSPAHAKNAASLRTRCDSMPSRASCTVDADRPPPRHLDLIDGMDAVRVESDTVAEWNRIPEEPDYCEMTPGTRDLMSTSIRSGSASHSRTSSLAVEEGSPAGGEYVPMSAEPLGARTASSGSVCSGTPSTDPRFSEYQLEPAMSHIIDDREDTRPARAYSVGSRPTGSAGAGGANGADGRSRAYSVGARHRPPAHAAHKHAPVAARASSSAPLLPRASDDHMELDFSKNSIKNVISRTPPSTSHMSMRSRNVDEYVDMRPGDGIARSPPLPAAPPSVPVATTPDGYVEMNYGPRSSSRPIAIAARPPPAPPAPPGSHTIFPLSLDSPADRDTDEPSHHLSTVREIVEDPTRRSPDVAQSPQYVALRLAPKSKQEETATVVKASTSGAPARFSVGDTPDSPTAETQPSGLNYAALDLEPKLVNAAPQSRTYTQIDFARSEKLQTNDN